MPIHQFNSFTGRLTQSTHLQPLYPISAHPLNKAETPKMIWDSIKTKPVKTVAHQSAGMSTVDPKILSLMKKFQADVEKPVFMMAGPKDKILFTTTTVLIGLGVAYCFKSLYDMANPNK